MLNYGDLGPFYLHSTDAFVSYLSAWSPQNLGYEGSSIPGLFFSGLLTKALFDEGGLAQKVFWLSLLPVACLSAYRLLSVLVRDSRSRILGSFLYVVNPMSSELFLSGSAFLLVYSLLPLAIYLFRAIINSPHRSRPLLLLSLTLGFVFSYNVQAPIILAPFLVVMIVRASLSRHHSFSMKRLAASLTVLGSTSFLLVFPVYSAYFGGLLAYYQGSSQLRYFASPVSIDSVVLGIRADFAHEWNIQNLIVFSAVAVLQWALYLRFRKKGTQAAIIELLVVATAMLVYWGLGSIGILDGLFRTFPVMASLETVKITMMIVSAEALATPLLIDSMLGRPIVINPSNGRERNPSFSGRNIKWVLTTALLIGLALSYNVNPYRHPIDMLNGQLFQGGQVSGVFEQAKALIDQYNTPENPFRVFWLPLDPAIASIVTAYFVNTPAMVVVDNDNLRVEFDQFVQGRIPNIGAYLGEASVRFVVLDLEASTGGGIWRHTGTPSLRPWGPPWRVAYYPSGDPVIFAQLLQMQSDLKLIVANSRFMIFENLHFLPMIFGRLVSGSNVTRLDLPFQRVSPTLYDVKVDTDQALTIDFLTTYSNSWTAHAGVGRISAIPTQLDFFNASAFLFEHGYHGIISIRDEEQSTREIQLWVWSIAWIGVTIAVLLVVVTSSLRGEVLKRRSTQQLRTSSEHTDKTVIYRLRQKSLHTQ